MTEKETVSRREQPLDTRKLPRGPLNWIFFPSALLYHELLLRAFDRQGDFFTGSLVLVVLFALGTGLFCSLLVNLLPHRRAACAAAIAVTALWTVLLCVEYCCRDYFKSYFAVTFLFHMTENVVTGFGGTMVTVVLARLPFILLSLAPLVLCILLRRRIITGQRMSGWSMGFLLTMALLFSLTGGGLARWGTYSDLYTYNFSSNTGAAAFGLNTAVRLETVYGIFGQPRPSLDVPASGDDSQPDPAGEGEGDADPTVDYGYNALDIDFAALETSASSTRLADMARYFGSLTPSKKNQYTGLFAGKNLILLTAEAFSPAFISQELTPTLYRLTHEGVVCDNFYQPAWGQSTTGGEFTVMTGLIPTWVNGNVSFYATAANSMPLTMGSQLRALGYTTRAYHNNLYSYYNRDKTHPNLGYDYQGVGNGLTLDSGGGWPYSDLEMVEKTLPACVEDYVTTGTPFHLYYMTVSGHGGYGWGHTIAAKNREKAVAAYPDASEQVQAYVAANLELENALAYLLSELEAAGIADDTVICMAADHYPYLLADGDVDYYNELRGTQDSERDTSRYRSALVLWCGGMDEPVVVEEPCTAVDILPTLSNLFGLEYDSRLLSGRDILDDDYSVTDTTGSIPLAVIPTTSGDSWATAAGTYESSTRTFTANPGVTVGEEYVSAINRRVALQYTYAELLVEYDYYALALPQQTP